MEISWEDGDNFIRNAVSIRCGRGPVQGPPARKMTRDDGLPIPIEDLMLDLRVDSDHEAETLERIQRGACDFLERRTGYVLIPGTYQLTLPGWWSGPMEIMRGPLREVDSVTYLAGPNDWQAADLDGFYVSDDARSFTVRPLSSFDRPQLWSEVGQVRLQFQAGYGTSDESGSDAFEAPEPGLLTVLTMTCGHYYKNRELFDAGKLEQLELGAMAFLGVYRQFW